MKLRRAMALAAATAVIAPAALLAAPAAYATDNPTTTTTTTGGTGTGTPEDPADPGTTTPGDPAKPGEDTNPENPAEPGDDTKPEDPADPGTTTPEDPAKPGDDTKPENPAKPGEGDEEEDGEELGEEPMFCEESKLDLTFKGLPGKIAAGSGWHEFNLNVHNPSKSIVSEIDYFAAASADKFGDNIFSTKKVVLQSYNYEMEAWEDLNDYGDSTGWVGQSNELKPGHEVNIPLRLNVKANAPVGVGFTLGAGLYYDAEENCLGGGETAWKFQIVSSGTDTDGTKPQEGGKVPLPAEKPVTNTASNVSGNLAETGSSSMLPTIGAIGGITILAGAGVMFAVKRRKGDEGAAA
ncbi:LPXTG cell wall anchor domain-containing protein [Streptomyces sp. A3M-1-3]|uniref:LAETG motif-containing sortase-dependent surface protein n=1 Tax=Streptomyces sp. A3M-1-3 TaxID=2962044 RepID=UPI0020B7AFD3|nr:LAETG motif-containing sortase-dependent surface protein [Streptomyces sp. A3M-1-3]MCP3819957.1 LPXTG cell wall anchor domain-containing protein [Streptomyces sp. A3M-1-3]